MPKPYQVKQGDTLLSIAEAFGFRTWEGIWNHESNARLRETRQDPQVLAPGDVVNIPEKKPKSVKVATLQKHTFKAKVIKSVFRTAVVDETGKPLANKRYSVTVGEKKKSGTTDEKGMVELEVPPVAADGLLEVDLGDASGKKLRFNLKVGHLDPIEKTAGVKARLTNLGFLCGEVNDAADDALKTALRNFQIVHKLAVTGEADAETKRVLLQRHDQRR